MMNDLMVYVVTVVYANSYMRATYFVRKKDLLWNILTQQHQQMCRKW